MTIGDGTVIGAASLVASNCEPFSVYAGNPARKVKNRPIDPAAFANFMNGSVAHAFSQLTGKQVPDTVNDAQPDDRVHIRIQFIDPVKGGAFAYQIYGETVAGKHFPLAAGSAFYQYCMQAKLPAGSEMDWHSNPLVLDMHPN